MLNLRCNICVGVVLWRSKQFSTFLKLLFMISGSLSMLAQLSLELGTAQPQLVSPTCTSVNN
jgi:hypothetical protein